MRGKEKKVRGSEGKLKRKKEKGATRELKVNNVEREWKVGRERREKGKAVRDAEGEEEGKEKGEMNEKERVGKGVIWRGEKVAILLKL